MDQNLHRSRHHLDNLTNHAKVKKQLAALQMQQEALANDCDLYGQLVCFKGRTTQDERDLQSYGQQL